MGNRLFVGSLSWNTDDQALRDAFERFGAVDDVKVMTDRETGRSRGFGFVTFTEAANASNAIREMDGSVLDGRTLSVSEAQERAPRAGGFGGGGGRGGGGFGGGGGGGGRGGGKSNRGSRDRW